MFNLIKRFGSKIRSLFSKGIDGAQLQELEKLLYEADLGVSLSKELVDHVRSAQSSDQVIDLLRSKLLELLRPAQDIPLAHPHVILVVGVNGSGKTTSVAKLAATYQKAGRKVLIAACDTFRAAAGEQLERWANSTGVQLIRSQNGSDPAAVAFDSLAAAKARGCDLVIIDTAGRLQTKTELMNELAKIHRVCKKQIPEAPHEVLLVIDATVGQNGVDQATLFHQYTPLTGMILTKLDGSAKGGVAVSLQSQTAIPIRWVGTGEEENDFEPFNPTSFVDALLST